MDTIKQLQQGLPREVDAALILSAHNRRYFTGFEATDGIFFATRQNACFLTDFRYIEAARAAVKGCEVRLLENRDREIAALFEENGVKTVGIETRELPFAQVKHIEKSFPGVRFDETEALSELIESLRMIKSPGEVALIRKAQEITDAAFTHIVEMIRPGVSERDIALEIEYFMKKSGASGPSFELIVVSGEKTSLPHGVPGDRVIQAGDFITMDIGARFGGYCSDMTRTVAVGRLSAEQKRVYDTVLTAQLEAERAVRAGVRCSEIDRVAREIIDGAGYRGCFGHGLGHAVGLEIHEAPRFSPNCRTLTRRGMVMTVEPGIYLGGLFGVRIEDMVVVTEDGCDILTRSPKELLIL